MTTATLPPGPSAPRTLQGVYGLLMPMRGMRELRERYGDAFTVNMPVFGSSVVISAPAEIKRLFRAGGDEVGNVEPNLGRVLGPNSMFALSGEQHRRQRKLLLPPFHGRRLAAYERIVEDETMRELAAWPDRAAFATLPSMMRITLNVMLRAVFGAGGTELARLRELLPRLVTLGSRLAVVQVPQIDLGRFSPWGRFWRLRREYDAIVDDLIAIARRDGDLDERKDMLALLLQSRYDDGSAMSRDEISDQLLALLTAGHETTATTLAWAVERLRRHPAVLGELVSEADTGGSGLRQAAITEVQRTRPVIDLVARQVTAQRFQLGQWTLPRGQTVVVSIALIHRDESLFTDARAFDPHRFAGVKPDLYQWIPFGGGTRRCLGAAFANMEMDVVLRTMLREVTLVPSGDRPERWHSRGVANAPGDGGRAIVRRRQHGGAAHTEPAVADTRTGGRP